MNITKHAMDKIGTDSDLHSRVMAAATSPQMTYESRMNGGGRRHVRDGLVAIVDRGTVITFYTHKDETPLRPDQMDDPKALAHAARVASAKVGRAVRDQKRNARRDRDRALTAALKQGGRKA